jgi:hypothetical protein
LCGRPRKVRSGATERWQGNGAGAGELAAGGRPRNLAGPEMAAEAAGFLRAARCRVSATWCRRAA